jgi:ubiquinone biosynthesis protein COQ9
MLMASLGLTEALNTSLRPYLDAEHYQKRLAIISLYISST